MSDRDVAAFDRRAGRYEAGALGEYHRRIADRVAGIARAAAPDAGRVLDIGCGTGTLLRLLAERLPAARLLTGIDAAPAMVAAAQRSTTDRRIRIEQARAEQLPFADDVFDLVVSTTSFDHWGDQARGLGECARVLQAGGPLVLCDLFHPVLMPTMWVGRRGRTRTVHSVQTSLRAAGFGSFTWHGHGLIRTVVAT